jgi:subtilisin family serine protease
MAALLTLLVSVLTPLPDRAQASSGSIVPGHYIVVFKDSVSHPGAVAEDQAEEVDAEVGSIYRSALKGYSASLPQGEVETLEEDPRVDYVAPDRRIEATSQTTSTGLRRIYAPERADLDIDEIDDMRVNADVAIIDSGVDYTHPDLNVVSRTDCIDGEGGCIDGTGTDKFGHGTHVAGIVGALDNEFGSVGTAPGVRIWAVKVLGDNNFGTASSVLDGIDWVTAHASEIEVANMSLGARGTYLPYEEAIDASMEAGVVYTISAGNEAEDANNFTPANVPGVITVSALSDYDGKPDGLTKQNCESTQPRGKDDNLAAYSNWGSVIDVAAPGTCIYSTFPTTGSVLGSNYGTISGTSMAAPFVAGAAAIMAGESNPNSMKDVEAIRQRIVDEGSLNWTDESDDGVQEPLLDVRQTAPDAVTTDPSLLTHSAKLAGIVNPGGVETTYKFEYGTTASYGQSAPVSPKAVGGGAKDIRVDETVSVQPETTYHYRVVATNSKGTFYGQDRAFVTSRWFLQSVPFSGGEATELNSVSCPSAITCMALGIGAGKLVSERWNGSEWSVVAIPSPSGGQIQLKMDVSCASASSCLAVGTTGTEVSAKPFALRWNGSEWTSLTLPLPSGAKATELAGVSCASATSCLAVGNYVSALEFGLVPGERKTLVMAWNGSEWSIQPSPNPEGRKLNRLAAVSCSSTVACTAVGGSTKSLADPATVTLGERWNGSSWSIESTPNPPGVTESAFEDVSCASAGFCMAAGGAGPANSRTGFTSSWNGTSWQVSSSGLSSVLSGVSCPSATSCHVEGVTFGQRWDGAEWSGESFASPVGAILVNLRDVSCASAGACTAVGGYFRKGFRPLAERLTPSTSLQTTQNPPPVTESSLEDVSCASATACVSVGNANKNGGSTPNGMAQSWNGSKWQLSPGSSAGALYGVSCVPATSFCAAVGQRYGGGAFAERWNGSGWSLQSTPEPSGATQVILKDVSCSSETACTAVGGYYKEGAKPMVERWNGSSWSLQTAPLPGGEAAGLNSVSCPSASTCMALGTSSAGKLVSERWNGSEWSVVAIPSPSGQLQPKMEISCASTTSCLAVGTTGIEAAAKPFALRWNGSEWTSLTLPAPSGTKATELAGVSCATSTSCLAVGNYATALEFGTIPSERKTLVMAWNGSEWSIQPSPNPEGRKLNRLAAVSCSSTVACTAVGGSTKSLADPATVTLGERWE